MADAEATRDAGPLVREHVAEGRLEAARVLLLEATQESVYRFLRHLVREDAAAQDLFQETYLHAFRALPRFRGEASLTTWMLTIARNLAIGRWRRLRTEAAWIDVVEEPPDRADPRVGEGSFRDLVALLHALPAAQREAVLLYYVEDHPVEEVARMTGRPLNTVKSDLRRARMALRARIDSGEEKAHGRP